MDSFVNLEADIDLPEDEGIVQIEQMGIFVSRMGFVVYSLELDELESSNSYMSLDKISRVIADISQDSSIVIDSLLTEFQRNIIEIIFGDPIHRPKTILYHGLDIKPRIEEIEEYYDGEDLEIEISQLLGESHTATKEDNFLYFKGNRGAIAITDSLDEYSEYEFVFWGIQRAMNNFLDSFMSRVWELYDESKDIKQMIKKAVAGDTDALNQVDEEITLLTSEISTISQVQEYLIDSIEELIEIYDSNKRDSREFFEVKKSLTISLRRIKETTKNINGILTDLEGLREYTKTLSELQMRKMSRAMTQNTKSMNQVIQANTRTSEAIDMIELILAGSIILDILAFSVGEITSEQTWFNLLTKGGTPSIDQILSFVLFLISIATWALIVFYLRRSKKKMELKALKDYIITLTINRPINVEKLENYINRRDIITKNVEYDNENWIINYNWNAEKDQNLQMYNIETVELTYNKTTALLNKIEVETSNLHQDYSKILETLITDLEQKGVLL